MRTKQERLESLLLRTQLQDTRHRVQKWNVGPEHRKERATFYGRFGKRTPFLRWRVQLQGYEKRRLETNHWTGVTQRTRNESCGYYGKWTSFLPFRVQLHYIYTKKQHTSLTLVCCYFFYLIEQLSVPYELLYDGFLESQLTMSKYFPLSLTRRILHPRYVEYPHRQLYYG